MERVWRWKSEMWVLECLGSIERMMVWRADGEKRWRESGDGSARKEYMIVVGLPGQARSRECEVKVR
jgi:hypothetical protein